MRYGIFGPDGRIVSAHNDDTLTTAPTGAVALSDAQWQRRYDLRVDSGNLIDDPQPAPEPSADEIIAALTRDVQVWLDAEARTRGYDGILSLCTYATSTNATFSVEGQAGVEWRDTVWGTCYTIMAAVKGGQRPVPTSSELIAELPPMVWP